MPLIDLKCPKCGYKTEELVKADGVYPLCEKCKTQLMQDYSGKLYVNAKKKENCSGNCRTCKGCSK